MSKLHVYVQLNHSSVYLKLTQHCESDKLPPPIFLSLISHSSKVMVKIFQARLQECVNQGLPDVQAGFRKGRGTRDQIANIHWIIEKSKGIAEKHLLLLH